LGLLKNLIAMAGLWGKAWFSRLSTAKQVWPCHPWLWIWTFSTAPRLPILVGKHAHVGPVRWYRLRRGVLYVITAQPKPDIRQVSSHCQLELRIRPVALRGDVENRVSSIRHWASCGKQSCPGAPGSSGESRSFFKNMLYAQPPWCIIYIQVMD
jgi:hypothetical protein